MSADKELYKVDSVSITLEEHGDNLRAYLAILPHPPEGTTMSQLEPSKALDVALDLLRILQGDTTEQDSSPVAEKSNQVFEKLQNAPTSTTVQ